MKFNFLTNKYVLYIIAFLSIINILGYFMNRNYGSVTFFALVAFLTFCFTKNMIIVLSIALFSTNLLASLANIFMSKNTTINNNTKLKTKEGFINNSSVDSEDKKKSLDIEGTTTKNGGASNFNMELFNPVNNNEFNKDISSKFDKSKELEKKNDFLQTQMTAKNIKEIEQKTNELLKEQDIMMQQIADFGPLLNNSLQAIANVTSGNIGGVITQLTNNLDALYAKYPEAFPDDYKETSEKMKGTMSEVSDEQDKINKALNSDKLNKNPKLKNQLVNLKKQFNL